jgi:hypothetical protein
LCHLLKVTEHLQIHLVHNDNSSINYGIYSSYQNKHLSREDNCFFRQNKHLSHEDNCTFCHKNTSHEDNFSFHQNKHLSHDDNCFLSQHIHFFHQTNCFFPHKGTLLFKTKNITRSVTHHILITILVKLITANCSYHQENLLFFNNDNHSLGH